MSSINSDVPNNIEQPREELNDLGFGSKVTRDSRLRLINEDGSFNIHRQGLNFFRSLSLYHSLLTMPVWKFYVCVIGGFVTVNIFFAIVYLLMGENVVAGVNADSLLERFVTCFFFSVQTFTTVGYGNMLPSGIAANLVATLDAFVGLLSFAMATGLLFARFSRPTARIKFSENALIAPYRDMTSLQFRIANERSNQLHDVEATVIYSEIQQDGDRRIRRFYGMPLERRRVALFPLYWNIVHPIDKDSPLAGKTQKDLYDSQAEILITITATDDTFSQTVHTRYSYRFDEITWDAKFSDMFHQPENGPISVDLRKLDLIEKIRNVPLIGSD